ncbi:MAG: amidohydrolase family protein [Microthrixaceae bacterium]|nr:amidohydrolase family protein [Microthrixaceae bacterium]MCO5318922.1 amidohydrolase family protein [Microthrixaceae bacterium]
MTTLTAAVDYWCNCFLPDREANWERAVERQALTLRFSRPGDEFCTPDEMVTRLHDSGFAQVVVVATPPPPAGTDDPNLFEHVAFRPEEVAGLARDHPRVFRGLWSVDPGSGERGVALAEEMLGEPWCVGLHNHTHSWDRRFDHPDFDPYYRLCEQQDVPFVMQAGASGGRFRHECGHPDGIDAPAAEFPTVRFVLSHTGWPWTTGTIERARRFPNVYLGTATWPLRRWEPELVDFVRGPGTSKVLYGSGFPITGHRQAARQFADPELTSALGDEVVTAVTSINARSVFTRLPDPGEPDPGEPTFDEPTFDEPTFDEPTFDEED